MTSKFEGRGQPKAGYRKTRAWYERNGIPVPGSKDKGAVSAKVHIHTAKAKGVAFESDADIETRLETRFGIADELVNSMIRGQTPAVIISGPPGLGKSYGVEKKLHEWDRYQDHHTIIKGFVGLTGLYKALYDYRKKKEIIVFDDADSIFQDLDAMNLLKGACDSSDVRRLSYLKETKMVSERDGKPIPREFEFNGGIIFITNEDFDAKIAKDHKLTPHFQALISRAHYVDLQMKNQRDYLVRMKQVVKKGMLRNRGMSNAQEAEIMKFVEDHKDNLRELSLRVVSKLSDLMVSSPNWKSIAANTMCKVA